MKLPNFKQTQALVIASLLTLASCNNGKGQSGSQPGPTETLTKKSTVLNTSVAQSLEELEEFNSADIIDAVSLSFNEIDFTKSNALLLENEVLPLILLAKSMIEERGTDVSDLDEMQLKIETFLSLTKQISNLKNGYYGKYIDVFVNNFGSEIKRSGVIDTLDYDSFQGFSAEEISEEQKEEITNSFRNILTQDLEAVASSLENRKEEIKSSKEEIISSINGKIEELNTILNSYRTSENEEERADLYHQYLTLHSQLIESNQKGLDFILIADKTNIGDIILENDVEGIISLTDDNVDLIDEDIFNSSVEAASAKIRNAANNLQDYDADDLSGEMISFPSSLAHYMTNNPDQVGNTISILGQTIIKNGDDRIKWDTAVQVLDYASFAVGITGIGALARLAVKTIAKKAAAEFGEKAALSMLRTKKFASYALGTSTASMAISTGLRFNTVYPQRKEIQSLRNALFTGLSKKGAEEMNVLYNDYISNRNALALNVGFLALGGGSYGGLKVLASKSKILKEAEEIQAMKEAEKTSQFWSKLTNSATSKIKSVKDKVAQSKMLKSTTESIKSLSQSIRNITSKKQKGVKSLSQKDLIDAIHKIDNTAKPELTAAKPLSQEDVIDAIYKLENSKESVKESLGTRILNGSKEIKEKIVSKSKTLKYKIMKGFDSLKSKFKKPETPVAETQVIETPVIETPVLEEVAPLSNQTVRKFKRNLEKRPILTAKSRLGNDLTTSFKNSEKQINETLVESSVNEGLVENAVNEGLENATVILNPKESLTTKLSNGTKTIKNKIVNGAKIIKDKIAQGFKNLKSKFKKPVRMTYGEEVQVEEMFKDAYKLKPENPFSLKNRTAERIEEISENVSTSLKNAKDATVQATKATKDKIVEGSKVIKDKIVEGSKKVASKFKKPEPEVKPKQTAKDLREKFKKRPIKPVRTKSKKGNKNSQPAKVETATNEESIVEVVKEEITTPSKPLNISAKQINEALKIKKQNEELRNASNIANSKKGRSKAYGPGNQKSDLNNSTVTNTKKSDQKSQRHN